MRIRPKHTRQDEDEVKAVLLAMKITEMDPRKRLFCERKVPSCSDLECDRSCVAHGIHLLLARDQIHMCFVQHIASPCILCDWCNLEKWKRESS